MEFEFDEVKSNSNKEKHGIDFIKAQDLWNDYNLVVIPAKIIDEQRFLAVGKIEDRHWSAIFTNRGDKIRIISVRRARREEIKIYES